ncbi:hypothetical protein SAMN05192532_1113 [Alteribacillus iranensis]|uniref:Uncharacterized protein n=1 Tax=Alteribacillus iranensis TaxID=930128 RepID=A0A1I2FET4_9BACI|nr:hypothetical protein SAMN05192532_1113 [Alteribacillus iranensis]
METGMSRSQDESTVQETAGLEISNNAPNSGGPA